MLIAITLDNYLIKVLLYIYCDVDHFCGVVIFDLYTHTLLSNDIQL